jgi:GNAT superfamily N-acetyltransferase
MHTDIRPYRHADLEAGRELWRQLTQRHRDIYDDPTIGGDDPGPYFDEHLRRPDLAGVWLATQQDRVVGLCGLLVQGDEGEVEPIVVADGYRSRGIGKSLLEAMVQEAERRGLHWLNIRPVARNAEAIACFFDAGFRVLGHLDLSRELSSGKSRSWKSGIEIHGCRFSY